MLFLALPGQGMAFLSLNAAGDYNIELKAKAKKNSKKQSKKKTTATAKKNADGKEKNAEDADNQQDSNANSTDKQQKKQRGKATYYSKRATGARTSSGRKLHHDSLTCAHRTYPFGTKLKVTNVSNKKFTIVTVTDRGPYSKGKIIDLTYRAAQELGMISQGVAVVEVEVYNEDITPLRPKQERYHPMEFDYAEIKSDSAKGDVIHPVWQATKKPHKPLPELH